MSPSSNILSSINFLSWPTLMPKKNNKNVHTQTTDKARSNLGDRGRACAHKPNRKLASRQVTLAPRCQIAKSTSSCSFFCLQFAALRADLQAVIVKIIHINLFDTVDAPRRHTHKFKLKHLLTCQISQHPGFAIGAKESQRSRINCAFYVPHSPCARGCLSNCYNGVPFVARH